MWGFRLGGVHSLALILHVVFLRLLRFWEVSVHIMYGDQWPGEVGTVTDDIEPRCFGGKPCGRMEVSDCVCQAWEIVNLVDSLPC